MVNRLKVVMSLKIDLPANMGVCSLVFKPGLERKRFSLSID